MLQNKRGTRCPRDGGLGLSSTVFPPPARQYRRWGVLR
nr:MAG TPA: hypothetical protein [Caudoviricetes sp.]